MQTFFLTKQNDTVTSTVSKQMNRQTNVLTHYFTNINWDGVIGKIISVAISIILLSVLFFFINWLGKKFISHSFKHTKRGQHLTSNRMNTIYTLSLIHI